MKLSRLIACVALLSLSSIAGSTTNNTDHWPQWRGPFHNGMAKGEAPVRWSDTENIKWKVEVPGRGHSTPVIWGDRLYLTTAVQTGKPAPATPVAEDQAPSNQQQQGRRGFGGGDGGPQPEHRFLLLCYDRATGKLIWERTAATAIPHEGYHRTYGSYASGSPVTDGRHVYASFGSRGVYSYDLDGNLKWKWDPGVQMRMRLQFGEGSAPALDGDRLILNYDHEGESFVVALNKNDGKVLWRKTRDEMSSWSSPFVVEHLGRKQVVVSATGKVRSYDYTTGDVIWECAGLGLNVIPMPVIQRDTVYVMSGFRNPQLMAIRLGRTGDLTDTDAVLWRYSRGLSYTPSPVLHENKVYFLTDNGLLSCFNATTGEPHYSQTRLPKPDNFKASPVGAAGKLYLASEGGDVTIVRMGEKFEVLAVNTLEDQVFIASPVIMGGEIFLRGQKHLFCVSEKKR